MKRTDLEHIIRAAGSIVEDNEIIVVGSQAVLGQYPEAPESLTRSMEADIYPKNKHHLSDLIIAFDDPSVPCFAPVWEPRRSSLRLQAVMM